MKVNIKTGLILGLIFLSGGLRAQSVENDLETRTSVQANIKLVKNLKLKVSPEIRFDENFSIKKYNIESELVYKPYKFLLLGATYRFIGDPKDNKPTEYLHRYALTAKLKKDFGRFETAFRLRYTDFADDDYEDGSEMMRYKASVDYDIAKCKLTPYVGIEAFQQLDGGDLYKMRYSLGMDYKLFKKNYLGVSYKLDYYMESLRNKHIVSLGYKIKF
ncbi:DUF2490 domain-containing protein [Carboxylicivirga sp. N1Y90]|uniref:DUF2490 domain-containing protein n=1 Tax=Carboxylicivirga fragile TaxID=3417571 RepID=UPI003D34B45E|nr:DUF2490 domain-containing protein [Marinilabiliaceae bacterium N1Y90]